ncbi:Complement receptor type [Desmophyllum pertusum]|uniref:Complement receptor type n=1 Tax=Desmophyllum pertusum TaxID=174260 RepID=A0A9W9ZP42_9CNID|nr:Complement receptor type [Desmophyllum pertusum]
MQQSQIMCKEPSDIRYGNKRVAGLQAGKYAQYWCYDSFTLVGSARITCLGTGKWSASPPKCQGM